MQRLYMTWFRCLADGCEHAVTDEEFARRNDTPAGRVSALCGHRVRFAPLIASDRPHCLRCRAVLQAHHRTVSQLAGGHRHRRPGVLRRLAAWLSMAPVVPSPADGAGFSGQNNRTPSAAVTS